MSMSRQDYVKFADIIAGEVALARTRASAAGAASIATLRAVMLSTADVFAQDNGRFNRATFYVACGFDADGFAPRAQHLTLRERLAGEDTAV